jgi:hypothetical protein
MFENLENASRGLHSERLFRGEANIPKTEKITGLDGGEYLRRKYESLSEELMLVYDSIKNGGETVELNQRRDRIKNQLITLRAEIKSLENTKQ